MGKVGGILVPGKRLAAAAQLAAASYFDGEKAPYVAIDVGCDHARLAVYLVQTDLCSHVYATDVASGPVQKAQKNIEQRTKKGKSLKDYITVLQTDGLCGLEKYRASRIFICGMGGQTIINILQNQNANFVRNKDKNPPVLILQPQSNAFDVRLYLYNNGFDIINETVVCDGRFVYPIICACYDGVPKQKSLIELAMGSINLEKRDEGFEKLFYIVKKSTFKRLCATKQNGLPHKQDEMLYSQMCEYEKNVLL